MNFTKKFDLFEGSRFNPKFDILEFEGRMHADDFLDWVNTFERVFEYCDPPRAAKGEVGGYVHKNASFWLENLRSCVKEMARRRLKLGKR